MRKKRRDVETGSLSFLDVVCCGFGAVILLLVITKIFEPIRLEETHVDLQNLIVKYEEELEDILGETRIISQERLATMDNVDLDETQIAQLQAELTRIRAEFLATQGDAEFSNELEGRLALAKQRLTEEMQRLLSDYRPDPDDYVVGGIPVDSEYIIFIIDTSGSMQRYAWSRVQQQVSETLQVYPQVKGIQVFNDMGEYMYASYRNEWIPDTPSTREAIIDGLGNWSAFSNSSPREGILEAIETFYDPTKKISLYVYSDDFSAGSINAVVREVDRRNLVGEDGTRRVRIHAVAFPVYYEVTNGELLSSARFAVLMRVLCQRNGGTFVALPSLRG
ncbi:MAG: VWA domain-containing protein [Gammaproteobacteria bacterium]|nr:VWA domain-containing protein [Gammaproteobacteria bacterium]